MREEIREKERMKCEVRVCVCVCVCENARRDRKRVTSVCLRQQAILDEKDKENEMSPVRFSHI